MRIPPFLVKGDVIGITAPSYSAVESKDGIRFRNAVKNLREAGYDTLFTPDTFGFGEGDQRAPAEQRAEELVSLFEDDAVTAIIFAKGGEHEHEILDLINWNIVEDRLKWAQGYSDNTSFLLKCTIEHDIATIYSGNFGDFGMEHWHISISDNLAFLEGRISEQRSFSYHETGFHDRVTQLEGIRDDEPTYWDSVTGDVEFRGRLLGGCMDILRDFVTNDDLDVGSFSERYPDDGTVWYMETYSTDEMEMRRMFEKMKGRGWFEDVKGFVFGRELFYQGDSYKGAITDELSEFDVPIVFDADVGHKAPRMVFVNGALSHFSITDGRCRLSYELDERNGS